jgi:hypothetical protein
MLAANSYLLGSWLSSHFFPPINSCPNLKFNHICIDMFPEIFTIPLSHVFLIFLFFIRSHGFGRARNTCRLTWHRYFPTVRGFKFFMPTISARVARRTKCLIIIWAWVLGIPVSSAIERELVPSACSGCHNRKPMDSKYTVVQSSGRVVERCRGKRTQPKRLDGSQCGIHS